MCYHATQCVSPFSACSVEKIDPNKEHQVREALRYYSIESTIALAVSFMINLFVTTVFLKGFYGTKEAGNIGLENAGQYLQEKFGGGFFLSSTFGELDY